MRIKTAKTRTTSLGSAALLSVALMGVVPSLAFARGGSRYINISLMGSLQKDIQQYTTSTRRSLGIEIGLPLTEFMEISLGHTQILDRDQYNEAYREAKKAQGVNLPEGPIEQKQQIADNSANISFGYSFGYVKPSLFAGALQRRACLEDTSYNYGCSNQNITWNAGLGLATYITMGTRFRVTYRLSPSVHQAGSKKSFDELVSIGLTWSM
ncbi:MAG: hypothetical protein FJY29_03560 [Betaproteobacteria bacterium]|nr:hypothetical protein [Betaproteobacteria bacterium]